MGIYRIMCRTRAVPCWRRNATLLWIVLILVGLVYFFYAKQHHSKSVSEFFLKPFQKSGSGFWDEHGGKELKVEEGEITALEGKNGHRVNIAGPVNFEEDDESNDEGGNVVENHIEAPNIGAEEVKNENEALKPANEEKEPEQDDIEEKEGRDVEKVEEVTVKDDSNINVNNDVKLEQDDLPEEDSHIKIADDGKVVTEDDKVSEEDRAKEEAERRRQEFENNKDKAGAGIIDKKAGLVDAVLPDVDTLRTWDEAKVEATFHNYLLLSQTPCGIIARMGSKQDGGWDVCHADGARPEVPCLMYSFGFHGDYTFENDVAKRYRCETHYFDPETPPVMGGEMATGVKVHRMSLSYDNGRSPEGWKLRTLSTIKKEFSPMKTIDILKIDIEDGEWRALPEMLASGSLGMVRQLLIELHVQSESEPEPSKEKYLSFLKCLRDLYIDGFRIAASRGSEEKRMSKYGMERSVNYEMLFLRV